MVQWAGADGCDGCDGCDRWFVNYLPTNTTDFITTKAKVKQEETAADVCEGGEGRSGGEEGRMG